LLITFYIEHLFRKNKVVL